CRLILFFFFFQAEDGIRDFHVTGVQTCALPISPLWSAVVYAMTFLPALFGGVGLSQLADRLPRRTLLVSCLLVQAVLVGIMAIRSEERRVGKECRYRWGRGREGKVG